MGEPSAQAGGTDRRMRDDLTRLLERHPYLARQDVRVEVVGGIVHLFGVVSTRLAKQAAWDIAWSVSETRDVEIDVEIEGVRVTEDPIVSEGLTTNGSRDEAVPPAANLPGDTHAWVVSPRGDLDLATSGRLSARLDEVIDAGAVMVILDLGAVDFLDSTGMRAIARAAHRLEDNGGRLLVENASGATQRTLEVAGMLEHLRLTDPAMHRS
jgi:anti-sigma B factor antagonist